MFCKKTLKRLFCNLMKQSFFFIFIFIFSSINGQNFSKVDAIAKEYSSHLNTAKKLAQKIENDFSDDSDKVRALYVWMTTHITYDLKEFYSGSKKYSFRYSSKEELRLKKEKRNNALVHQTLKSKKAVCEGYAQSIKKVCDLLAIECNVVSGYSKTMALEIGKIPLGGKHAWNVVKINKQWKFIDATWGAGYGDENNRWIRKFDPFYFFSNPSNLITSHFPENEKWQLLNKKLTKRDFANAPIFSSLFYKKGLVLKRPTSGTLSSKRKDFFKIQFRKIDQAIEFGYAYQSDFYMTTLIPTFSKGIATLKIPCKGKNNTTLNILAGNDVILQYKIN